MRYSNTNHLHPRVAHTTTHRKPWWLHWLTVLRQCSRCVWWQPVRLYVVVLVRCCMVVYGYMLRLYAENVKSMVCKFVIHECIKSSRVGLNGVQGRWMTFWPYYKYIFYRERRIRDVGEKTPPKLDIGESLKSGTGFTTAYHMLHYLICVKYGFMKDQRYYYSGT